MTVIALRCSNGPSPHPLPQIIRDKLKHIGSTTCANNSEEGEPECGCRKGAERPGKASKPYVRKSAHPTTVILRTVLRRRRVAAEDHTGNSAGRLNGPERLPLGMRNHILCGWGGVDIENDAIQKRTRFRIRWGTTQTGCFRLIGEATPATVRPALDLSNDASQRELA